MIAQSLVRTIKRGRKLDCIAALLITAVSGCGDDVVHPTFPEPTPDIAWQLSAAYGGVYSIWGDSSGEGFALNGQDSGSWVLHYDGSTWTRESLAPGLNDIWGSSASDVFVVGQEGAIFHYDGATWTAMTSPTTENLRAIWGSAANDVYAVGDTYTIVHYDGVEWTLRAAPGSGRDHESFRDVWGSSPSDVFVVSSSFTPCPNCRTMIYHYDGYYWNVSLESGGNVIWGNAGDDVFVGGPSGTIRHYDGHGWTQIETGIQSDILGAWGSSTNDMYFVAGGSLTSPSSPVAVYHWDGSTCTESMRLSEPYNLYYRTWLGAILWGRSPTDIFVGGSEFRHYDGSRWRQVLGLIPGGSIGAVGVVSDSGLVTATWDGESLWQTYGYDGAEWKFLGDIDADIHIEGIWGSSFSDIFAIGAGGSIWRYDGVRWSIRAWAPAGLNGMWGTSGSDVFAVGDGGTILHYDGTTWSWMPSGTTISLGAVWGNSSTDVFAAGTSSEAGPLVILHYDGSSWSEMTRHYVGKGYLRGIRSTSHGNVFFFGQFGSDGTIVHYDGTTWSPMRLGGDYDVRDIWGRSRNDLYAATDRGIVHYDGSTWRPLDPGVVMSRIWGTRTDVFGVGEGGVYRLSRP